jgi:hypothetical protein
MTIREAMRRGVRTLSRSKRVLLLFYVATTAAALFITAPVIAIAFKSLGDSAWAREMTGNLDVSWLSELSAAGALPGTPITVILIGTGALSIIVYLFLLGGALQVFCTGEPFFAGCGRNFWRLVRLTLISLVFYAGVLVAYSRIGAVGRKIWGEGSVDTPLMYWGWFRAAVVLCLFGLVNLVFDYARISLVAEDQRKALHATVAATRFVWKNFRGTAGLYGVVCVIAALFFAAYLGISHSFAQTSLGLVLLLLLVRQAMVFAKIWSRLLFYTAGLEMYTALKPPPPVVIERAPEPEPESAVEPPSVRVQLSPDLGINAFAFITAWNQTQECRAAAEAGLSNLAGNEGIVFDPGRLLGSTVVLSRLAEGIDLTILCDVIRSALDAHGPHAPLQIHESLDSNGSPLVTVAFQTE